MPATYAPSCRSRASVRVLLVSMLLTSLVVETGCVRRRFFVNSNPPGAEVFVDNQPIGTTPCAVDFTYYGTREVRIRKAGFETLTVNQPIPAPWYQFPGVDFVSENLVPAQIRDNRSVTYNLTPQMVIPASELIGRGEELRRATQAIDIRPANENRIDPLANQQTN